MNGFLINGDDLILKNVTFEGSGMRNINMMLDSLECIQSVVAYPNNSIFWLQYQNDIANGAQPNDISFPSFIKKHFNMTVNDFLLCDFNEQNFLEFEDECIQSCAIISLEQVERAYRQMLFLYNIM